jgi:hypothetical protein
MFEIRMKCTPGPLARRFHSNKVLDDIVQDLSDLLQEVSIDEFQRKSSEFSHKFDDMRKTVTDKVRESNIT